MSNSLERPAQYEIEICDGNSCHMRKSKKILKAILAELDLSEEKTETDDQKFSIKLSRCFDQCATGPLMKINGQLYEQLTSDKALDIVRGL